MSDRAPTTEAVELSEMPDRLPSLVDQVARKTTRVLVERSGVPVAALVSADDLEHLARLDAEREGFRQLLARMREPFKDIPPEQIERDVVAIIREMRDEDEAMIEAEERATVDRRPA